jgi:hypothetical protein
MKKYLSALLLVMLMVSVKSQVVKLKNIKELKQAKRRCITTTTAPSSTQLITITTLQ